MISQNGSISNAGQCFSRGDERNFKIFKIGFLQVSQKCFYWYLHFKSVPSLKQGWLTKLKYILKSNHSMKSNICNPKAKRNL